MATDPKTLDLHSKVYDALTQALPVDTPFDAFQQATDAVMEALGKHSMPLSEAIVINGKGANVWSTSAQSAVLIGVLTQKALVEVGQIEANGRRPVIVRGWVADSMVKLQ